MSNGRSLLTLTSNLFQDKLQHSFDSVSVENWIRENRIMFPQPSLNNVVIIQEEEKEESVYLPDLKKLKKMLQVFFAKELITDCIDLIQKQANRPLTKDVFNQHWSNIVQRYVYGKVSDAEMKEILGDIDTTTTSQTAFGTRDGVRKFMRYWTKLVAHPRSVDEFPNLHHPKIQEFLNLVFNGGISALFLSERQIIKDAVTKHSRFVTVPDATETTCIKINLLDTTLHVMLPPYYAYLPDIND